jgi:formyltetrahydrofolate synthetase
VRQAALDAGAMAAVEANHWAEGGRGAVQLAEAVIAACAASRAAGADAGFRFLYPLELSIKEKIETVATQIYGAATVTYSAEAEAKIAAYTAQGACRLVSAYVLPKGLRD